MWFPKAISTAYIIEFNPTDGVIINAIRNVAHGELPKIRHVIFGGLYLKTAGVLSGDTSPTWWLSERHMSPASTRIYTPARLANIDRGTLVI